MSVWRVEVKVYAETADVPPYTFLITPPPDHPAVVELLKWHEEEQYKALLASSNDIGGFM